MSIYMLLSSSLSSPRQPSSLHIKEHNQERPHRHAQRTVSMVVLDFVRLKISPNRHRYRKAILSE